MSGVGDFLFGDSGGDPAAIANPAAQQAIAALFPGGAPGLPTPNEMVFNPASILEGLGFLGTQTGQALDFAGNQFGQAALFQQPFLNQAQGTQALQAGVLGGAFDPRNNLNAFVAGPGNPEFDFRFNRGVDAVDRGASARGLLRTGGREKALTEFGQGLASTFSTEDLNRRLALSNANFGRLAGLAGIEQGAANNLSNISTGLGTLGANALTGFGTSGLGAFTNIANLQNAANLANVNNNLQAQLAALNAFTGLSGSTVPVTPPTTGLIQAMLMSAAESAGSSAGGG